MKSNRDKTLQNKLISLFDIQANSMKQSLLYEHYCSGSLPFDSLNEIQLQNNELVTSTTFNISFRHLLDNDLYIENLLYEKINSDQSNGYFAIQEVDNVSDLSIKDKSMMLRCNSDMVLGFDNNDGALFSLMPKNEPTYLSTYGNDIDKRATYNFLTYYKNRRLLKINGSTIFVQIPKSNTITDVEFRKLLELGDLTGVPLVESDIADVAEYTPNDFVDNQFKGRIISTVESSIWRILGSCDYLVSTDDGLKGVCGSQITDIVFSNTNGIRKWYVCDFINVNEEPTLILVGQDPDERGGAIRMFYVSLTSYPPLFNETTIRELHGVYLDGVNGMPLSKPWSIFNFSDDISLALMEDGGFLMFTDFQYGFPQNERTFNESVLKAKDGGLISTQSLDAPHHGTKRVKLDDMEESAEIDPDTHINLSNQGAYWSIDGSKIKNDIRPNATKFEQWDLSEAGVTCGLEDIVAISNDVVLFNKSVEEDGQTTDLLYGFVSGVKKWTKVGGWSGNNWGKVSQDGGVTSRTVGELFLENNLSFIPECDGFFASMFNGLNEDNVVSKIQGTSLWNTLKNGLDNLSVSVQPSVVYERTSGTVKLQECLQGYTDTDKTKLYLLRDKFKTSKVTDAALPSTLPQYSLQGIDDLKQRVISLVIGNIANMVNSNPLSGVVSYKSLTIDDLTTLSIPSCPASDIKTQLKNRAKEIIDNTSAASRANDREVPIDWYSVVSSLYVCDYYKKHIQTAVYYYEWKNMAKTTSGFSTTKSYKEGDYVVKDTLLYRAKSDLAAGAWNSSNWSEDASCKKYRETDSTYKDSNLKTAIDTYLAWNENIKSDFFKYAYELLNTKYEGTSKVAIPTFDSNKSYAAGSLVINNNNVYKCTKYYGNEIEQAFNSSFSLFTTSVYNPTESYEVGMYVTKGSGNNLSLYECTYPYKAAFESYFTLIPNISFDSCKNGDLFVHYWYQPDEWSADDSSEYDDSSPYDDSSEYDEEDYDPGSDRTSFAVGIRSTADLTSNFTAVDVVNDIGDDGDEDEDEDFVQSSISIKATKSISNFISVTVPQSGDPIPALNDFYLSVEDVVYCYDAGAYKVTSIPTDVADSSLPAFSSSSTYSENTIVRYSGTAYKCINDITTAGSWNADDWVEVFNLKHFFTLAQSDFAGIAEYNASTRYGEGDFCKKDEMYYKSLYNTPSDPTSFNSCFTSVSFKQFPPSSGVSYNIGDIVKKASTTTASSSAFYLCIDSYTATPSFNASFTQITSPDLPQIDPIEVQVEYYNTYSTTSPESVPRTDPFIGTCFFTNLYRRDGSMSFGSNSVTDNNLSINFNNVTVSSTVHLIDSLDNTTATSSFSFDIPQLSTDESKFTITGTLKFSTATRENGGFTTNMNLTSCKINGASFVISVDAATHTFTVTDSESTAGVTHTVVVKVDDEKIFRNFFHEQTIKNMFAAANVPMSFINDLTRWYIEKNIFAQRTGTTPQLGNSIDSDYYKYCCKPDEWYKTRSDHPFLVGKNAYGESIYTADWITHARYSNNDAIFWNNAYENLNIPAVDKYYSYTSAGSSFANDTYTLQDVELSTHITLIATKNKSKTQSIEIRSGEADVTCTFSLEVSSNIDDSCSEVEIKSVELASYPPTVTSAISGTAISSVALYTPPTFSTSKTYAVGKLVIHDGKWYKCSTKIDTAGAWNSNKWTEIEPYFKTYIKEMFKEGKSSITLSNLIKITLEDTLKNAEENVYSKDLQFSAASFSFSRGATGSVEQFYNNITTLMNGWKASNPYPVKFTTARPDAVYSVILGDVSLQTSWVKAVSKALVLTVQPDYITKDSITVTATNTNDVWGIDLEVDPVIAMPFLRSRMNAEGKKLLSKTSKVTTAVDCFDNVLLKALVSTNANVHETVMNAALDDVNDYTGKAYAIYNVVENEIPDIMYHVLNGNQNDFVGLKDRKILRYSSDDIKSALMLDRIGHGIKPFTVVPYDVKVLPFDLDETKRFTSACSSCADIVYWINVTDNNSYGLSGSRNPYPYIDDDRIKGMFKFVDSSVDDSEGRLHKKITNLVYAPTLGKIIVSVDGSNDLYCFRTDLLKSQEDLVYVLDQSKDCTIYKTMYSGSCGNESIKALYLSDRNEVTYTRDDFNGNFNLVVEFENAGTTNIQKFTFTKLMESEPYARVALTNIFPDENLMAAYRQYHDMPIYGISKTDDGLSLISSTGITEFVTDGTGSYARQTGRIAFNTIPKFFDTSDVVYSSYYLNEKFELKCLNTTDAMADLFPYNTIDLTAIIPELKNHLKDIIVYDIDMTAWSTKTTMSYIVMYTNLGVYLVDMGLSPGKLKYESKDAVKQFFKERIAKAFGSHIKTRHHERTILTRFLDSRYKISDFTIYDFATLTTNVKYTSPTERHGGHCDTPGKSVTVDKQVFFAGSVVSPADENPGVVFAAVQTPITKYDNRWRKVQIASPLVDTAFYDYFYKVEVAPNGSELLKNILNLNHLPFIYRHNTDNTWDMWINIPSTMTPYMNRMVGASMNVKGGRVKVEGNMSKIRKNLNNMGVIADPKEQATVLRLYINLAHFHASSVTDATICGGSLPMHVYRDSNANDGLFDGIALQSVWNKKVQTVTDKHGVSYAMLEFKVWGTDEQSIHLRGEISTEQGK